jgi:hypothetical protein
MHTDHGKGSSEMRVASRATCDQESMSKKLNLQRWRTLDRLLRVSFGRISPAYMFGPFF